MNRVCFNGKQLTALVCLVVAGAVVLAGQAKPTNLFKEASDRKGKIVWTNAPATMVPAEVCAVLSCVTSGNKFIARPKVTEAGKPVARALILSQDAKKADVFLLLHQSPSEAYFFSLGPDGAVQKAAYWVTGKPWVAMG